MADLPDRSNAPGAEDPLIIKLGLVVDGGFRKLVPYIGEEKAFTIYGEPISKYGTPQSAPYVLVSIRVNLPDKKIIMVVRGEHNVLALKWLDFNLDNWKNTLELYASINDVGSAVLDHLYALGFTK